MLACEDPRRSKLVVQRLQMRSLMVKVWVPSARETVYLENAAERNGFLSLRNQGTAIGHRHLSAKPVPSPSCL